MVPGWGHVIRRKCRIGLAVITGPPRPTKSPNPRLVSIWGKDARTGSDIFSITVFWPSGVPPTVLGASHRSIVMKYDVFRAKDLLVWLLGSILADLALSVAEPTSTGSSIF